MLAPQHAKQRILEFSLKTYMYSQISLIWTPKGQNQVSALQRYPYYRGRDVWFLAFLGPNELSIIERCLYYRGVCKERLYCTHTCSIILLLNHFLRNILAKQSAIFTQEGSQKGENSFFIHAWAEYYLQPSSVRWHWLHMSRSFFIHSYLQFTWWALEPMRRTNN